MRLKKASLALGLLTVSALTLTACTPGSNNGGDTDAGSDAIVSTNGTEPENPLIPTNTNEVGGGKILDLVFAQLVSYEPDGSPVNEVAESIEPNDDNTLWTITVADGWTFTDGTPVTASSFTEAWNWAAQVSNAQSSAADAFGIIEGFNADADSELTGLTVVDDSTFTVQLNAPVSDFSTRLGWVAYSPLPEAFYDDTEAFGVSPIGNGPYMLDGEDAWQNDVGIDLVVNPDYAGVREPQNDGISIRFYTSADGFYNDLASDNLDVIDAIPANALPTYEDELDGRTYNEPTAVFQNFTIPYYLDHFGADEEGTLRRQAISLAVDRELIIEQIFSGTRTPAVDFSAPTIDGFSDSLEGNDVFDFDPERAVELWAEADAIRPYSGTFSIAYNADGDHEPWVTAATNSIANTLGITAQGQPITTFAEFLTLRDERAVDGAYRSGWQGSYPALSYFLEPLYVTGAGSNDFDYSSAEFDAAIEEARNAPSPEEAVELYQAAEEILVQDLPVVPLWYSNANGAWSTLVDNVDFAWNGVPVFHAITKG